MTPRSALFSALVLAAVACAGACRILDQPSQCANDGDCAQFNARCDVSQAICIPLTASNDLTSKPDGSASAILPDGAPATAPGTSDPPLPDRCLVGSKPTATISELVANGGAGKDITLDCDKDWSLDQVLSMAPGTTLTIAAGTTVRAKKAIGAAIVVPPGAKIMAQGRRDAPVVLTVDDAAPKPGDWRGLFVLGKAPRTGTAPFQGDATLQYGGTDPDDESGVLSFVRVEYGTNGVVFGALGRKTTIDSVQARRVASDCFDFQGGTMDAKHLVCQSPGDEHFEVMEGYVGRLEFLFGQRAPAGDGHNGLLIDGAQSAPTIYNVTICGQSPATQAQSFGLVFRNAASFDVNDAVITGWAAGLNAVGPPGKPPTLKGSVAFDNVANPARTEDGAANDDNGFDEIGFFRDAANVETDPGLVDCYDALAPKPWPKATLSNGAQKPPDGFFDANASFVGAFRDENDTWMTGAWVRFDDK